MYQLVKNDTAPQIKATITREDTGNIVDMSGGTVRLKFRKKGSTTILFTLTADSDVNNLSNGIAIFTFGDGNLDLAEGYYEGEIEVTYSNSTVETIYEVLDFYLRGDF